MLTHASALSGTLGASQMLGGGNSVTGPPRTLPHNPAPHRLPLHPAHAASPRSPIRSSCAFASAVNVSMSSGFVPVLLISTRMSPTAAVQ